MASAIVERVLERAEAQKSLEILESNNDPTNPKLWARAKKLAEERFDFYSHQAHGWAYKWYEQKGGEWLGEEITDELIDECAEKVTDYLYEEGINEDGLDIIIEEVGIDDFAQFVLESADSLFEETEEGRPARKMNVRTLKATKKKAEEIKADKSDVVSRKTSPKDALQRAAATRAFKTPKLVRSTPKKAAVVKKKVDSGVQKAKETQPKKETSRVGLLGKIKGAVRDAKARDLKGVRKVRDTVRKVQKSEFGKGVVSGVKAVGQAAKDIDSVLKVNKKKTVNMQSYEPEGDTIQEVSTTRIPSQNGNVYDLMYSWRGKTYFCKMFFPEPGKPSKSEVQVALQKVYPSAILRNCVISSVNYGDPYIHAGKGDGFTA